MPRLIQPQRRQKRTLLLSGDRILLGPDVVELLQDVPVEME
jgi:hypothetical protein